jgi:uncharacterized protein (DUF924 family)
MSQVPVTPESVVAFWFPDGPEPQPEQHLDLWVWRMRGGANAEVIEKYSEVTQRAVEGEFDGWAETPIGRLALILILDQFPRTVWAGSPRAYAQDQKALRLCLDGFGNGHFDALPNVWFKAAYKLPLEHCEDADHLANLDRAVAIAEALADEAPADLRELYKVGVRQPMLHRDVIAAFGRHPHRNDILGRASTDAERAFLAKGDLPHQTDLKAMAKAVL